MRLKRELLDALAEQADFPVPEGMVRGRVRPDLAAASRPTARQGRLDAEDKDKDEETLRAEYRAIAERRVRLGCCSPRSAGPTAITVGTRRDDPGDARRGRRAIRARRRR